MKKIREISQSPAVILLVLMNFIFVSCNRDEILQDEVRLKTSAKSFKVNPLSGEELFKSIIFADGVLTKNITPLANLDLSGTLNQIELREYRATENDAIAYIKSLDENYFEKFKNAMSSGDPELINTAIDKVSEVLTPFIMKRLDENSVSYDEVLNVSEKYKNEVKNIKDFVAGKQICLAGPVAVAIAIVAIAAVMVVGFGYWWAKASTKIAADNSLYKDEIILAITQSFNK